MTHASQLRARVLASHPLRVVVVGCGGTGSMVLSALSQQIHPALCALYGGGLEVHAVDADTVSPANLGRQWFYPGDVGLNKAEVLINRINLTCGTGWHAYPNRLNASSVLGHVDLLIGCVDTRVARYAIMRAMERATGPRYYLDFGNRAKDGQVVLGQVTNAGRQTNRSDKLPHVGELFPEIMDLSVPEDDAPSCSLAQALEKQSLMVNRTVVAHGMEILWDLLRDGELSRHGAFINVATSTVRPIPVDPEYWAKLGYGSQKTPIRHRRPTTRRKAVKKR